MKRTFPAILTVAVLAVTAPAAVADAKSKAAQEAAEYVLQRFGRQAAKDGVQGLAHQIEQTALRHGDDVFKAVRKLGPRSLHLVEEAGVNGKQVARVLAEHGEHGAVWIVARPKGLSLFLKHGDDCARVLCKHPGVVEPVIEHFGQPAVRALDAVGAQNGRRLGMLAESGELAKLAQPAEMLDVIAKYGNPACDFVWRNKGALAITTVAIAFMANPQPFIDGTKSLAQVVAENAVKPLAEVPAIAAKEAAGEVARRTNWTPVFLVAIAALTLVATAWWWQARPVAPAPPPAGAVSVQPTASAVVLPKAKE